jgi:hypothetical protein
VSPVVDVLLERAFRQADPTRANEAIEEARLEIEDRTGQQAFSYELFVPRANVDEYFLSHALPKLVNFLHCRGFKSASTPGVFVSLFTPSGLAFIEAGAVVEALAGLKHLSIEETWRRYGDGGTGDPKLLGL